MPTSRQSRRFALILVSLALWIITTTSAHAQRDLTDIIAFRPIDASIGGDGTLYVSDWYNPIIQHGEVDFRDKRRDRSRGRIWRISAKQGSLSQPPAYETLEIPALLDLLLQSDLSARQFARLELKTRDAAETLAALNPWVDDADSGADSDSEREL